jgi:hypothetical protein
MALSDEQLRFEDLADLNATKAAIRAGDSAAVLRWPTARRRLRDPATPLSSR